MSAVIDGKTMQKLIVSLACMCVFASANASTNAGAETFKLRAESSTREADYTLGSSARQHITVHVPPGFELDPASLPARFDARAANAR